MTRPLAELRRQYLDTPDALAHLRAQAWASSPTPAARPLIRPEFWLD
ncbi:hypothetical protein PPSIR1_03843 [Plesiocystis pacifica SIR-1]|uniref:Uncharacterized protein n=1 Tax=Plesiocystis pacifica SIR-1 TaxID=391625 RepID=A6G4C7_9BACT|nr:hypothetical protein [Plesiocystis pacifica]EDM79239.1 hypothetical protein PPSIR1_03843 [Plesiocystis pacifica SIR-1]